MSCAAAGGGGSEGAGGISASIREGEPPPVGERVEGERAEGEGGAATGTSPPACTTRCSSCLMRSISAASTSRLCDASALSSAVDSMPGTADDGSADGSTTRLLFPPVLLGSLRFQNEADFFCTQLTRSLSSTSSLVRCASFVEPPETRFERPSTNSKSSAYPILPERSMSRARNVSTSNCLRPR